MIFRTPAAGSAGCYELLMIPDWVEVDFCIAWRKPLTIGLTWDLGFRIWGSCGGEGRRIEIAKQIERMKRVWGWCDFASGRTENKPVQPPMIWLLNGKMFHLR